MKQKTKQLIKEAIKKNLIYKFGSWIKTQLIVRRYYLFKMEKTKETTTPQIPLPYCDEELVNADLEPLNPNATIFKDRKTNKLFGFNQKGKLERLQTGYNL